MTDNKAKKIAWFGGTFDPPHAGHLEVAHRVLADKVADEVWFVPAFAPPHKDGEVISRFEHRKKMLELLLQGQSAMWVCDVESRMGKTPTYTIDTLGELERQNPDCEFALLIGGDSLEQLGTWHQTELLLQRYEILVYPRQKFDFDGALAKLPKVSGARVVRVAGEFCPVSSTEVRNKLEKNQNTDNIIPEAVLHYIKENALYGQK